MMGSPCVWALPVLPSMVGSLTEGPHCTGLQPSLTTGLLSFDLSSHSVTLSSRQTCHLVDRIWNRDSFTEPFPPVQEAGAHRAVPHDAAGTPAPRWGSQDRDNFSPSVSAGVDGGRATLDAGSTAVSRARCPWEVVGSPGLAARAPRCALQVPNAPQPCHVLSCLSPCLVP